MRSAQGLFGFSALVALASGCGGHASGPGTPVDASGDAPPDGGGDGDGGGPRVIRVTATCSLAQALAAAAGSGAASSGDCPAGSGYDTIELPAGTYSTAATLAPASSVEIRGAGMGQSVIVVGGDGITCGVSLATPGAMVRLTSLTLSGPGGAAAPGSTTGVCVTAGALRLRHARVTGFSAGGLHVEASAGGDGAELAVYNSLVDGNRNPGDGGGIAFIGAASTLSIDQSSIVGNTSDGMGGGVYAFGGSNATYIFNTTMSGNVARRGGGIAARILDVTYFGIYWSTVAENRALEIGGGLYVLGDGLDAHGTATASVVVANSADGDATQASLNADWPPGFSCTSSIMDLSALPAMPLNVGDSCRFDLADVGLGPLMDMGGADHLPVHALLPGSPAVDATDMARPFDMVEERDAWNGAAGDPPVGTDPGDAPPWTLFGGDPGDSLLADLGAYELHPRWQAELLSAVDGAPATITALDGASHGAASSLAATAPGDFVTYAVPVPEAGSYAVSARVGTGPGAGMWQLSVSDGPGSPSGPVGGVQDGFAAAPGWTTLELGSVSFTSAGGKPFTFAVTGRNGQSTGYGLVLDYLTVTKR